MRKSGIFVVVLLGVTILSAHPHFNKTITAQLPGNVEATIAYQTVPANEDHTNAAPNGTFVTPRSPKLTLVGRPDGGIIVDSSRGVHHRGRQEQPQRLDSGPVWRNAGSR